MFSNGKHMLLISVSFFILFFTCCGGGGGEQSIIVPTSPSTNTASIVLTSPACATDCPGEPSRISDTQWRAYDATCECINDTIENFASAGDTVIVPIGNITWNKHLKITKGIIIKGSGIGSTIITSNITDQTNGVISFKPDATARTANAAFRLTGFTINCNNMSNGLMLVNQTSTIMNRIRIDHNKIINPGGTNAGRGIYISGTIYGVIDNNIIETGTAKAIDAYGVNEQAWMNFTQDRGNANNIYYEDNTIIGDMTYHSAGQGGRYVSRYNNYSGSQRNRFPVFDIHGNQGTTYSNCSSMVAEIYGNRVEMGIYGGNLVDHRGGRCSFSFSIVGCIGTESFT